MVFRRASVWFLVPGTIFGTRNPKLDPGSKIWLGRCFEQFQGLEKHGKIKEALAWLESVLANKDDNFNLRMAYARLLTDEKDFNKAREQFEILYIQTPDNSDLLYALGLLSLQEDNPDDSKKYFTRLIELKKHIFDAKYYLGRIAVEKNDLKKANEFYKSVHGG